MAISGLIIAGGRATRMGGVDKGLVLLQQKSLIQHVLDRLTPQISEILINANREIKQYEALGYPVLQDETSDFIGPLAGFNLGLKHAKYDYLLTVPCDSPLLPLDLVERLLSSLLKHNAEIAFATSDADAHPVFCLCKESVLPSLTNYLQQGGRKVSAWQKSLNYVEVDFTDNAEAFINLNTLKDLAALELQLKYSYE